MNNRIIVLKRFILIDILACVATGLFIFAGTMVSLHRFWQYEVFYYNFGIFDQAIWHVSRFRPPIIEHLLVGGKPLFADHFDVSILLLAPLFWITDRSEILLVAQAVFTGLAGLIIYAIGVHALRDKLMALAILICYFFFVGIQSAVITDFHDLTVMTLPLALTFWAIVKGHLKTFWLFFLITIGFKEVTVLLGISIALFLIMYRPSWKIHGVIAIVFSLTWGALTFKVLIPYFSGGIYLHQPVFPETIGGKISALWDHPLKRTTVWYSLLQFGFLPIFFPAMWFAIVQDYVVRFLPKFVETRWSLGLQYNAPVSVLLGVASVFGYALIQKLVRSFRYLIALFLVGNAFVLFRFVHHGPFLLAVNPAFYEHTNNFHFLDEAIAVIPKDASIMTQNNLGARFTHQRFMYLRLNYESFAPDYILLDAREGQNPNNTLFSGSIEQILKKVRSDEQYELIYHRGDQYVFRRRPREEK